jgi:hypothetical protein
MHSFLQVLCKLSVSLITCQHNLRGSGHCVCVNSVLIGTAMQRCNEYFKLSLTSECLRDIPEQFCDIFLSFKFLCHSIFLAQMPPLPPTIRLSVFSKGSERSFATI